MANHRIHNIIRSDLLATGLGTTSAKLSDTNQPTLVCFLDLGTSTPSFSLCY